VRGIVVKQTDNEGNEITMMNTKPVDVREKKRALLAKLKPLAAAMKKQPELQAQEDAARLAHTTFFNDPRRGASESDQQRLIELHGEMTRAIDARRSNLDAGRDAERQIAAIESSLGAAAAAERIAKELKRLVADCIAEEKHVLALEDVRAVIAGEIDQILSRSAAARAEDANRAIEARLAGKTASPAKPTAPTGDLARLDAERCAAEAQLAAATDNLARLAQQEKELESALLRAKARAVDLDYEQALEDMRPLAEYRAAVCRVANIIESDLRLDINQIAVQQIVEELRAEHRVWQPTIRGTEATQPAADAGASAATQAAA
jgi:hypothetical protein